MSDKSDVIAALEGVRRETLKAIDGIPDDKMATPAFGTWSVKDILSHLTSWEQLAVHDLERVGRGHIPQLATFRMEDVDDWNAWLMRSRNLFPLPQVRTELEESRARFLDALNALPEGLFESGGLARTLADGLCNGEKGHASEIMEWRKQQGL